MDQQTEPEIEPSSARRRIGMKIGLILAVVLVIALILGWLGPRVVSTTDLSVPGSQMPTAH